MRHNWQNRIVDCVFFMHTQGIPPCQDKGTEHNIRFKMLFCRSKDMCVCGRGERTSSEGSPISSTSQQPTKMAASAVKLVTLPQSCATDTMA